MNMEAVVNLIPFGTPCGEDIERYLREKAKDSERTATNYRSDINRMLREVFNTSIEDVTVEQLNSIDYNTLVDYRHDLTSNLSNGTVNRYINTIKSLLKNLKANNIIKIDISFLDAIKNLATRTDEIDHMPPEVVHHYIEEAGKDRNYPKLKQVLIKIAVECALRLDEALSLEIGQFSVDGNEVILRGYGKGSEEYFDKLKIELYEEMVEVSGADVGNPKDKVFSALNTKNITDMMTRIKKKLNYSNKNYSFHSLKKTSVTYAYRLTGDILEAQRKGRHKSLDTTRKYLKNEDYGMTGMFSTQSLDSDMYKKVSHKELVKAVSEMNKDFQFLLNAKLNSLK